MRQEPSDTRQRYTIGEAVTALRREWPDVTHSSLRFLEREGLVTPGRSPGGHRHYRPRDLDRVRQVKSWQADRLSLEEIRGRLAESDASDPGDLSRRFLDLAAAGDVSGATRVVLHADDLGLAPGRLLDDVLTPALIEVGDRWQAGELAVGQEHEISELARDLIGELTLRHARPGSGGPAVLAACVAGERHDLGLRMVLAALRWRGARVHFLGADVPAPFLLESVELRRPDLVLLSATLEARLDAMRETVEALAGPDASLRVVAGGQGCQRYRAELERRGARVIDRHGVEAIAAAILG